MGYKGIAWHNNAIDRVFYHHPNVTVLMASMILRENFSVPPPLPTEEEREYAGPMVEVMLSNYYDNLFAAIEEVTGEDPRGWD